MKLAKWQYSCAITLTRRSRVLVSLSYNDVAGTELTFIVDDFLSELDERVMTTGGARFQSIGILRTDGLPSPICSARSGGKLLTPDDLNTSG